MLGRDFDAILLGAFGDPRVSSNIHAKEILLGMRFRMDLYANVRPVRLLDASLCPLKGIEPKDVDFVVVRENTEGVYVDAGGVFKPGTPDEIAVQEDINTRKGVERVIRYAFEYCERHKKQDGSPRHRVLMCDKSNAMTHAGGLWQRVFKEVGKEYPQITSEHMYVDAFCTQMVRDPRQFDVIVTNNMFGDIITDLAAALQGGLGMAASGNIHPGKTSMFEPVHGSAPLIAGKNIANPFGAILTAALMLEHLGLTAEAGKIEAAVLEAVRQKKTTQDIGGSLGTRDAGGWIAERLSFRSG
jgi:3-isopropylmalate dehydrogenase